jgi:hypothetical protein
MIDLVVISFGSQSFIEKHETAFLAAMMEIPFDFFLGLIVGNLYARKNQ